MTTTQILTLTAATGSGLMSGLFFAYSTFTMTGLRRLPDASGLAAMQAINRAAERDIVMLAALFGTGIACVATLVDALGEPGAGAMLRSVGSIAAAVGTVGLTMAFHVPLNRALDRVDPGTPGAATQWRRYARRWTAANHLRTVLPLAGTVALIAGLLG